MLCDFVDERLVLQPAGAVVHHHAHERGEARGLAFPVAHYRQRADHEMRPRNSGEMGKRRGCLAQTHVVGQATAQAETVQELQPAQSAPLIRAQGGGERVGHVAIGQRFVGQTVEQLARPAGGLQQVGTAAFVVGDAGCLQLALEFSGERQQLQRAHLAMVGAVLLQVGERATSLGTVDLHPATADLNQVGAILGCAAQHVVGYRCVVDNDLPVDQCGGREPTAAGGILRLGCSASGGAPTGELLGCQQLDADGGQRVDALQRSGRGVEVDSAGRRDEGGVEPGGQLGHGSGDCLACLAQSALQHRDEACVVRERECGGPAVHHLVGRAPTSAVVAVDQLQAERPVTVGLYVVDVVVAVDVAVDVDVVADGVPQLVGSLLAGQAETQAHANDGFALRTTCDQRELGGDVGDSFTELGCHRELPGVSDERPADQANGAGVDGAGFVEVLAPAARRQRQPAQPIDHGTQYVDRVDWSASGHHGRHRVKQLGFGHFDIAGERLPLGQPPHVGDVGEHGQHPATANQLRGVPVDGAKPRNRGTEFRAQRVELTE